MDWDKILLVGAALLPAIALCTYVFKKDRVEKEPMGLLIGLLVAGCVICFPAAWIETVLHSIIDSIFAPYAVDYVGMLVFRPGTFKAYAACTTFIGVALVEEGLKLLVLYLITRKNRNFNCLFDGLIYSVFVSLGFAALENVLYVLKNGWMNAVMRGVMSVPGHMFFAVLMGYYYSRWHIQMKARGMERELKEKGTIASNTEEFSGKKYMWLALVVPVLAHGLYNYCCTIGTNSAMVALFAFLIFLYIYCFKKIKKMSKADASENVYSLALILEKYPFLIKEEQEREDA